MKHTKEELLGKIVRCDAMQAKWGSKSSKLCGEYAEKYSEFKAGDRVEITNKYGVKEFGKVHLIFFDASRLFTYVVSIWKKDFSNVKGRRNHIWVNMHKPFNEIKKATQ